VTALRRTCALPITKSNIGLQAVLTRLTAVLVASAALTGCASTGAVPRPFPGATTPSAPGAPSATGAPSVASLPDGYSISSTALSLRGTPYRNGGIDPNGFDCSGFVKYVFEQHGVAMPRDTKSQFDVGADVDPSLLEPGDLVFFTTVSPGASHVGIVVGGDQFVHAPNSSGVVRVEHLSSQYWSSRFVGARRIY
jgi:cell wall-associated NlpC family hydrolase